MHIHLVHLGRVPYAEGLAIQARVVAVSADIRPGADRTAVFRYSTDGKNFTQIGTSFTLNSRWQFFMGYRYGIFDYATKALGGAVKVASFTVAMPK